MMGAPGAAAAPLPALPGASPPPADFQSPSRRNMPPIATPSPATTAGTGSPGNYATATRNQSRPGSPIGQAQQSGIHVTSLAPHEAKVPLMPPPPHMLLHNIQPKPPVVRPLRLAWCMHDSRHLHLRLACRAPLSRRLQPTARVPGHCARRLIPVFNTHTCVRPRVLIVPEHTARAPAGAHARE